MSTSFPGESKKYRAARDKLLQEEIELRRASEAVAAARRALPPGGKVPENYVFDAYGPEGDPIKVHAGGAVRTRERNRLHLQHDVPAVTG
ncbi:MAG: DUF899 family protein [Acidimicrobiales bacterium]